MDDEKLLEVIEKLSKSVKDVTTLIEDLTNRVNKLEQHSIRQRDMIKDSFE